MLLHVPESIMTRDESNRGLPGSWIIFSYFSNIDGKASSQHLDDRIPYLAALGVKPVVVSSVCGKKRSDVPNYRIPSVAPSGIRFELRYLKRRNKIIKFPAILLTVLILPFYLLEKAIINLESEWSWFPLAFLRGLLLSWKSRPELIYSTGGPVSAHIAAGMLARVRKIPWIAELQDPIVYKDWHRSRTALKMNLHIEKFILENASAAVFLTEGAKEKAIQRTKVETGRIHVIYPGACPPNEPLTIYKKGDFCRFAHFGSLGGTRNPQKFLEGIQIILDQNPDLIEKVRLDFYGTLDKSSGKHLDEFKYRELISNFGKVPRLDALRAMKKSDSLVLIQNLDEQSCETIPSKVYEYLQMNRPILGLVHKNPHLEKILLENGHFSARACSPAEISGQITQIIELWRRGDLDSLNFPSSPYTVQEAAEKLLVISRGVKTAL